MKREEEIRQASIEYTIGTRPMCIGGGAFSELIDELNRCKPFEDGANWADKTMIEKAREWVKNAFTGVFEEGLSNSIADEFVKAMKGE